MDAFVARQPIFDRHQKVHGYELLFRSGLESSFGGTNGDQATAKVISDSLFLHGLEVLTEGRPAFINVTREVLLRDLVNMLPPTSTVIEILESIEPDEILLSTFRDLRNRGYRIALDDFRFHPRWEPLFEFVDIVKVDVLALDRREVASLAKRLKGRRITLLAEKVETQDTLQYAMDLGYELFQGYVYARPTIVSTPDIPAHQLHVLDMLREIHKPDMDLNAIEAIIAREVALSYKLLRYINTSFFGWQGTVSSIHQAVLLLGERELRRWALVIALAGMVNDKPGALVTEALVRGRFCELVAADAGLPLRQDDLFLTGVLSLIDALLSVPLAQILEKLPVVDDVSAALLGHSGPMGDVLETVISYSAGDWDVVAFRCNRLGLQESVLPAHYAAAVEWASGARPASDTAAA